VFSPDATRLLLVGGDAVAVLDAATRKQLQRWDIPAVVAAALSPQGTFMVTFQRPTKTESGAGGRTRKGARLPPLNPDASYDHHTRRKLLMLPMTTTVVFG
jgi:hypothetical protein